VALDERADVHHSDDAAFDVDRYTEHRADALLSEDGVYDVGVVEVLDDDGTRLSGDAAREATSKRHLDALAHLLLESSCGARNEDATILVEQQHRCGVDVERTADALKQLGEHVLEGHVSERGIGDAEQVVAAALGYRGAARGLHCGYRYLGP
jgi:hypothetical protein